MTRDRTAYFAAHYQRTREHRRAAAAARYQRQRVQPDAVMAWVTAWRLRRLRGCLRALGVVS